MTERQLIPKGKYLARADSAVMGRTGTGKEQVAVQFTITAPESQTGRALTWYGYFTENTTERTLDSLDYCGWDGNGFGPESLASLSANEVQIVIEHEPDNQGVIRDKIAWVNKANSGPVVKEELDAGSVASLENRLKGELMKRRGKTRPTSQQRQPRREQPSARSSRDDDFGPENYDDPGF